jgi:RNase P subunit RPR2
MSASFAERQAELRFNAGCAAAFAGPSLRQDLQDRRVDRLRRWGSTDLYRLECSDCSVELAMSLDALSSAGAPGCQCGGVFRSERLDEIVDAEREAHELESAPRRLQDRLLKTRKDHLCSSCHSDIPKGETARYRVEIIEGELWSSYRCPRCESGVWDPESSNAHQELASTDSQIGIGAYAPSGERR